MNSRRITQTMEETRSDNQNDSTDSIDSTPDSQSAELKPHEAVKARFALAYENSAYVPDCLAESADSSDSFVHELQQYRLVSANGYHHRQLTNSEQESPRQSENDQQHQENAATELSLLDGGGGAGSRDSVMSSSSPAPPQWSTSATTMLKPLPVGRRQTASHSRSGARMAGLPPETKLRLQRLLRQNAGVLRHDATSILLGVYNIAPGQMSNKELDKRFSAVAMEMLREQEDRDLHPFGRGGRFEGVLYSRRVKVQVDHTKFLAWIVFASFILLTSGAIIFLAEMERRQKFQQSLLPTTTISTIDGLSHGNRNG